MPELPDLAVYRDALAKRLAGQTLLRVWVRNPFVLRTAVPPVDEAEGRRVVDVRRLAASGSCSRWRMDTSSCCI